LKDVNLSSSGKWILAGEHAVLRGGDALVFPLESRTVNMLGQAQVCLRHQGMVYFTAEGDLSNELPSLFIAVLNRAFDLLSEKNLQIRGNLHIVNKLPFGAGLGASASVCVLITNLLFDLGLLDDAERFNFARQLENIFHGESSGVDVAVSLVNKPIRFNRETGYQLLVTRYKPHITLHYSGKRGVTRECIEVVKNLIFQNPSLGERLDEKMVTAVKMCEKALLDSNTELLSEAIQLAAQIYEAWGLIDPMSQSLTNRLFSEGAMAVKPTGSGLGGYLLALWPNGSQSYSGLNGIPAFLNMR